MVNLNHTIADYLASPEFDKLQSFHPHISIDPTLEEPLPNIEGAAIQLQKILMNLVSNAAEAQPAGGTVTLKTANRYVEMPLNVYEKIPPGDYVTLEVTDDGVGISPEYLGRIFEPFFSKKRMGRSGTGLGMAVVWGTVHDHGGFIDIASEEGSGTTVTLYFPVTQKNAAPTGNPIPIDTYVGNGERILVVDDVPEQREIASRLLGKLNYRVEAVDSGEEAVDYLRNHTVQLLVLDMIMDPGIDGLETYRRALSLHPGQKAIIASGYAETDRVREAQGLGAGAYLRKPYTMEKIGIAVKTALAGDP